MSNIKTYTPAEMAEAFTHLVAQADTSVEDRHEELMKLKKEELVALIMESEKTRNHKGITVQDLAKAMLKSEDHLGVNYETIAQAIRILIPDAQTSSKSIASYVSKKGEDWNLPARYLIRQSKVK